MAGPRRIALFVEGDSERGDARRQMLAPFFHRWLDPQLPEMSKVGIMVVKFQGVSNYLDDVAQKVRLFLDDGRANFVFGLVDLYGIPQSRIDLLKCATIRDKVETARAYIRNLVLPLYRNRFRQHFAVHEVEAWLLACPEVWPRAVRDEIQRRPPEEVNFNEPPAKYLKRILGGRYKKKAMAMNLFPRINPQAASEKCYYLNALMQDLLRVAKILQ
jgi:hypothetical protein